MKSLIAVVLVLFSCVLANAQNVAVTLSGNSVSFIWNANAPTGVSGTNTTGYKIHIGPSSGNYTQIFDAGNATTLTVTTLSNGTWFAVVKAYNSLGTESGGSNEVSFTLSTPTPTPTVSPTATPSPTAKPTPTPTVSPTAPPSATPSPTVTPSPTPTFVKFGQTSVLPNPDHNNAGLIMAQWTPLHVIGTLQTLSFFVKTAAGTLRLGLYSDNHGIPGSLLASTPMFTAKTGWNTANVTNPVKLATGNYWLAYAPSSNSLSFVKKTFVGKGYALGQFVYGPLPAIFPKITETDTVQWSFYGTLSTP